MLNLVKPAIVGCFVLAGTALMADDLKLSSIDVEASYAAAADSNAEALYPQITEDLRRAIAQRVSTSDDAADPALRVDIRRISLDGDTILPDSAEFNELEGVVSVNDKSGEIDGRSFPVAITARADAATLPEGWIQIAPGADDFYDAMVTAFADNVAASLENVNTSGNAVNR